MSLPFLIHLDTLFARTRSGHHGGMGLSPRISAQQILEFARDREVTLAVPDLHGAAALTRHLGEVLGQAGRPVVFLGDYVDCRESGQDYSSMETIELLLSFRAQHPDWVFLRGNHELMLLEDLDRPEGDERVYELEAGPMSALVE